ncbi:MAG: methyl-accepting chemotaxis protein [Candidatus Acidiferrales bacterium]
MRGLGLRTKLAMGSGLLLAMLVLLGAVGYYAIVKITVATEAANTSQKKKDLAALSEIAVRKQIQAANDHTFNGDPPSLQRYADAKKEVHQRLDDLSKILVDAKEKELLAALVASTNQISVLTDQQIDLQRQSRTYEATSLAFSPQEESAIKSVVDDAARLEANEDALAQDDLAAERTTQSRANIRSLALVLGGLLVGIITTVLMARSINQSVTRMSAMIREIAGKNLTVADITVTSQDELGAAGQALNTMKNSLGELIHSIATSAKGVASASERVSGITQQITAGALETSSQATVVSNATHHVSENLQTVSTGAQEMTTTIRSISVNAHEAASVVKEAVQIAQTADATITKLGHSSAEIGAVIKVITAIAQQTNLLALNATIEAARAGEAGKGFAVVANEVKELAKQTAAATEDIGGKIAAIQQDTKAAVDAIANIHSVIQKISDISASIATAVEEQSATTNEMSRNVTEAASGAGDISTNIGGVAQAANESAASAHQSQEAVQQLAEISTDLNFLVAQFRINTNNDTGRALL